MNQGNKMDMKRAPYGGPTDGGFKVAVKRRKGVPKSENKNIRYFKSINGCEDTSLARAINKFETKHKRSVNVDDVVELFRSLQTEDPHGEVIYTQGTTTTHNNYYSVLDVEVLCYEEEPITINDKEYYQHVRRTKRKKMRHEYSFEEIIFEHKYLLGVKEHNSMLDRYHVPHVEIFGRKFPIGNSLGKSGARNDPPGDVIEEPVVATSFVLDDKQAFIKNIAPAIKSVRDELPESDKYIDLIEDMLYIVYILSYCSDPNILFGALLSIYKRHSGGSITSKIYDMVYKLAFSAHEPQSGDYRTFFSKVLNLRHTILFQRICEGLSLCIAFGFLEPIHITYQNLTIFSCKASDISEKSGDLFQYIIDLLTYFFEMGHQLFRGDTDRIFDVSELSKIDNDIIHLKTYIQSIQLGSYAHDTNLTIDDYYTRLQDTISSLKLLVANTKDRSNRLLLNNKLASVYQLLVLFEQSKPLTGLREAPFSLCFYGASSVGKSSSAKMVLTNVLNFNKRGCTDEYICVIQPTDKFYSTYKANVTGVIVDDLANTNHLKAVVDPASLLISLVNNIPFYAPKAEAAEKGKINVRPAVVVVTTNKQDLEANIWSNEPISVVRRLKYHIEVKVRPEYSTNNGLDPNKIPDSEKQTLLRTGIQDLWLFTVRYVERYIQNNVERWRFSEVTFEGRALVDIDMYSLIRFLNIKSREHFIEQEEFVRMSKDSGARHESCDVCCWPKVRCCCPAAPPDDSVQGAVYGKFDSACDYVALNLAQGAMRFLSYAIPLFDKRIRSFLDPMLPNYAEKVFTSVAFKYFGYSVLSSDCFALINYTPTSVRTMEWYKKFHLYINRHRFYKILFLKTTVTALFLTYTPGKWGKFAVLSMSGVISTIYLRTTYLNTMQELSDAPLNKIVPLIQSNAGIRNVFKVGVSATFALIVLKTVKHIYNATNALSKLEYHQEGDDDIHGNLQPTSHEDVEVRDGETNIWSKKVEKLDPNPNTTTMTTEQLLNKIKPNILSLVLPFDEHTGLAIGCVALKSNIYCCPLHFFKEDKNIYGNFRQGNVTPMEGENAVLYRLKFVKHDGNNGNSFSAIINKDDIVQVGDLDLCVFVASAGGSFPDITPYLQFPNAECLTRTIRRNRMGELINGHANIRPGEASYWVPGAFFGKRKFNIQGGRCIYDRVTSCGDCMMVHVSDTRSPAVVGFHISGMANTVHGSFTMFKSDQLQLALEKLNNLHRVFTPMSGGYMDLSRLGVTLPITDNVDNKAPVSYIKDHNFIVRGSVGDQVTYYSDIKPTFMCPKVEAIFNTTNVWAGPKFGPQRWKPWHTFLAASSANDSSMNSGLLRLSMNDYINPLLKTLKLYDVNERIRPLHHHEIINGIPGKRFIDHINFNSAIGFPLRGKKKEHMYGVPGNYEFLDKELITTEFDKMRDRYKRGERYYPIFKASLKDEPIEMSKDKVRVFQAADITLQYAWRKYGLPILRFLSMYPLMSECAVGINPYSDEWDQLHRYLTFGGKHQDRIVAGDYKKWDQKLPAQLVLAAFQIIVNIAENIPGYTPEDVVVIKGLATDTTFYLSHFNGTLIEFNNGLPSGHNLTAHINSIANALLLRYGYYFYKNPAPFRDHCHAITYGDDFECGVTNKVVNFDHLKYKAIVEGLGMTLTMPDKTSNPLPFLHIDKCDFLKRRSVMCDIDGKYYGALDFTSMLRSLMVKGKTTVNPKEHAHAVLRGFIHDLSYHTREFYNTNIVLVRRLLDEIGMIIPESSLTYDEFYQHRLRNLEWWEYDQQDVLDNATIPVGYPMTPEASGNSIDTLDFSVSTSPETTNFECGLNSSEALANSNTELSYLSTKVLGESDPRRDHIDDSLHSEAFGSSEGLSNTNITESGTATLSSSAQHTSQDLSLVSKDMLSLRQHDSRSLSSYLERPRRIMTYNPANATASTIYPLWMFLQTEVIRDKIRWYAYLNAVLHVKVVVVGSPLIAGSQIVSLHPWWRRDNGLKDLAFGNATPSITQLSQLPNVVTDLSQEKGGEISMPIICPSNGLDITDVEQIKSAFALHVANLTPTILYSTASTVVPEVAVYAWLTDVSLTGTTMSTELPQSDEYNRDNENIPSSDEISLKKSISASAGKIVGKATEVGVDRLMSAMGFSNPNSMAGVMPSVPRITNNMACYNAPVNIDSLAGDYKNEVSLDAKALGFEDIDHMALSNIYTRYSIIGTCSFTTGARTTGPIETVVFPVTPMACDEFNRGSYSIFTPTALGVAALPFNRWRGTITYKFRAVGTAFMKGKIKISHDVKSSPSINDNQKHDLQLLNSVIWDLATNKEIEVMVPWASNQPFKTTGLLQEGIIPLTSATIPPSVDANGMLIMCPFTAISESNPNIHIIVSIKGEPGFAFGDMRAVLANYTFAGIDNAFTGTPELPQSIDYFDIPISAVDYNMSDEYNLRLKDGTHYPINPTIWFTYFANRYLLEGVKDEPQSLLYTDNLNSSIITGNDTDTIMKVNINGLEDNVDDHDNMAMTCMGEKWYSVRQIIKRYTHNWTRAIRPPNARDGYYRIRLPDRPIVKGWQGSYSLNIQPNNVPVTYARDSFLSFYSMCFLGYRGSHRHKVMVKSSHNATNLADQPIVLVTRSTSGYVEERVDLNAVTNSNSTASISASASAIPSMPDARAGAALGYSLVNPVLEYSTPFYSRGKFCWAQDRYPQLLKSSSDGGYDVPWHQIIVYGYNNGFNVSTRIDKYIAAGDDYSLYFYMYGPQMVLAQPSSWSQT